MIIDNLSESNMPRIYVACLAAYNAGSLHGVWLDAEDDLDSLKAAIDAMLRASPEPYAEEYAIHDYEDFGEYSVGEYESLADVHEVARFIDEADDEELAGALLGSFSIDEAERLLSDAYAGVFDSLEDFAVEISDTSSVPEHVEPYIDFQALGMSMQNGGEIFTERTSSGLHVFWNF